ncbi:CPBP family intramembrane glutamic endopeptidase [Empedobacter brevis]|uniref:CPBP family intramembrane glutamic endopeptidase n=1 Tax=Empedobacter brevis TaxID=247 RepID=UPI0039B0C730
MKIYLQQLIAFYKNPTDERIKDYSIKKNIVYIIYTFLLDFILCLPILLLMYVLELLNLSPKIIEKLDYRTETLPFIIIFSIFFVPILEEIIFRFPLRRNSLFAKFITEKQWKNIFRYLVYSIPLLFGFVHLTNYNQYNLQLILLSPILIGSQTIGGYLYTFMRVRFNLISTIVCHIFWNFVPITMGIAYSNFSKPYESTTSDYSVTIKYHEYFTPEKQSLTIDSANGWIYAIDSKQYSINHLVDTICLTERLDTDFIIDFNLKSKKGITKSQFLEIIKKYDEE